MTNYFRKPDALVDAVRAVLSGQPTEAQEDVERKADAKMVKVKLPDGKVVMRKEKSKIHIGKGKDEAVEAMDPVDKKALKGKHKDRKDKDIDNDGDVDGTDKYLHKRRKAVSKAIGEAEKKDDDDDDEKEKAKKNKVTGKKDDIDLEPKMADVNMVAEKEMTPAQKKKREEIVMSMKKKMGDFKKKYGDRAKDVMYATATKMAMAEGFELEDEHYDYIFEDATAKSVAQSLTAGRGGDKKNPNYWKKGAPAKPVAPGKPKKGMSNNLKGEEVEEDIVGTVKKVGSAIKKFATQKAPTMSDRDKKMPKIYQDKMRKVTGEEVEEAKSPSYEVDIIAKDFIKQGAKSKDAYKEAMKLAKKMSNREKQDIIKKGKSSLYYLKLKEEVALDEGRGRPRKDGTASDDRENIQMQLRKSITMRGAKHVEFADGKKVKVKPQHASAVLKKISSIKQSRDKQNAVNHITKSHKNMMDFHNDKAGEIDPAKRKKAAMDVFKK